MMISCRELDELLTGHMDGTLGLGDRLRVRLHLMLCPDCRRHAEKMRQLVRSLGRLPEAGEAPPEILGCFEQLKRSQGLAGEQDSATTD